MIRHALTVLGLLLLAAFTARAEDEKGPLDFKVRDWEGKELDLKDHKGKVVLIDWWASWCGPCRVVIPELIRLQEKYGDKGLQVLGVTVNRDRQSGEPAYDTEKKFVADTEFGADKKKVNYPVFMYTDEYREWVIKTTAPDGRFGIPTLVFVNRKGEYVSYHRGSGNVKAIEAEVKKLLAEASESKEGAKEAQKKDEAKATRSANGIDALAFENLDGKKVELASFQGKVVVLDVWATWCPPCRAEMPHFQELVDEFGADKLVIVGVSDDEGDDRVQKVRDFVKKNSLEYVFLMSNPEGLKALGKHTDRGEIWAYPTTFVIDAEGRVVKHFVGAAGMDAFRPLIKQHLPKSADAPPPPRADAEDF